ncbi:Alpha-mannosidase [Rhynchospora pubera]|uniref:Alpha-mannosidase n=1 Tax=Rhynchospora pubera TaxID=906938 RepID=A0AAV8H409_9POAL|nr:Alpha-mannosidase [Rhynchospora pubera]
MASLSRLFLLLFLFLVHLRRCTVDAVYIAYNTSAGIVEGKLNVHLVPHTHDDVGWLKTVDQYYVGSNNSIQGACVQNVLDSMVQALMEDKNRKFIYVEQAFFQRWWRQQSNAVKDLVRRFVKSGQLEFINGGMCMHDEATVHYIDMMDQTTLGHRFLKVEFEIVPKIGWQIDPFGHSAVQAYLLSAEVGFDALYFSRIDYQDLTKRKDTKTLEVIWRGSKSLSSSSDVFTGIFPKDYEPPPGDFYFEVDDTSPVVQDDPLLFDYNVQERVNDFVAAAVSQANITRSNHIMFTMGTDFRYQYAKSWFRQLDKFIHYVNLDGRVNTFYSTPSIYTKAKHASNESWPLKTDDFFPYADGLNRYWTGYFTSRPALKGYIRVLSGYYLAARQLELLTSSRNKKGPTTDSLGDALALTQHHDAVTGTEKQHVANDYAKRLAIGYTEAERLVGKSLSYLAESAFGSGLSNTSTKFEQCLLINVTYCPSSELHLSSGKRLVVLVYNSLGWNREDVIRIPVASELVLVQDHEGTEIESQIIPIANASLDLRRTYVKAYTGNSPSMEPKFWLAFSVSVPPFGFSTYFITPTKEKGSKAIISDSYVPQENGISTIREVGSGNLRLKFDTEKGISYHYSNRRTSVNSSIEQSYLYYKGFDGSKTDTQSSGAYVFRPNGTVSVAPEIKTPLAVYKGPILDEVHFKITPWIQQIVRAYKKKEHVEVEYIVGPIPIDDKVGKEVVTQFSTFMETNKTFYTDSNGRDFIKRIRDFRSDWELKVHEPVAGNYYPLNLGMFIKDKSTELSLLVDRAIGGSSILDGQVELMLHRRLLHDDGKGVDESLNETVCVNDKCDGLIVQGKFYLNVDPLGEGARWRRTTGQEIYSPLLLAFSEEEIGTKWTGKHITTLSLTGNSYKLPDNVALITLQSLEDGSVLLRLAHLYEVGEDKNLSVMANVNLKKLFKGNKIRGIKETSLTANQGRDEMEKNRLKWRIEGSDGLEGPVRGRPVDSSELVVELAPMEIRTFLLLFDSVSYDF